MLAPESIDSPEIICVSPDEWRRLSLAKVLEEAGYRVRTCATTRELLQLAARWLHTGRGGTGRCVILDGQLDGSTTAAKVIGVLRRAHLPVRTIVFSTLDDRDDVIECLRLGASDFVHLPLVPSEILDVVHRVVALPYIR